MWLKAKSPNQAKPGENTLLACKETNAAFSKYQMHGGMSSPVPNWLFDVKFYWTKWVKENFDLVDGDTPNDTFKCIKADLPQYEQTTKEVWFLGTKKTFVVSRDTSGETTMEFWLRKPTATDGNVDGKVSLIDILAPNAGKFKTTDWKHFEFERIFENIELTAMNADTTNFKTYKLFNPIITNFSHSGELNYEGEEGLKISITVHYDAWENI